MARIGSKFVVLLMIMMFCSTASAEVLIGENVIDVVEGLLMSSSEGYPDLNSPNETVDDIWLEPELGINDSVYDGNDEIFVANNEDYFLEQEEYPKNAYVYVDEEAVFCPINVSVSNQDLRLGVNKVIGKSGENFNFYAANSSTSWPMEEVYMRITFQQDDFEFSYGSNMSGSSMAKRTISAACLIEEGIELNKPLQVSVELLSENIDSNFEDNFYIGCFKIEENIGGNIFDDMEEDSALYNDYSEENNSSWYYYEDFDYSAERDYYENIYSIKRIM